MAKSKKCVLSVEVYKYPYCGRPKLCIFMKNFRTGKSSKLIKVIQWLDYTIINLVNIENINIVVQS